MRDRFFRCALILAVLTLILALPVKAGYFTYDPEEAEDTPDFAADLGEALPDDIKDKLGWDDLADLFGENGSANPDPTAPATAPWQSVLTELCESVISRIVPSLAAFGSLAAVIVLAAVTRTVAADAPPTFAYLVRVTLALAVIRLGEDSVAVLCAASERLCTTCTAIIPVLCAVTASGGSVTTAVLERTGFSMILTLAQTLFSRLVLPAVRASLILSAVAYVTDQKPPAAIASFLRTFTSVTCAASMTAFAFIFNVRMKLGEAADGALIRTVKFALGSFVPVVGGAVSDAAGQLGASMSYIRASFGVIAVCAVLLLTVPVIVRLICDRTVIFVCRHVSAAVTEKDEPLFADLGASFTLMIAYAVSAAVMFVLCFTALVSSASAN